MWYNKAALILLLLVCLGSFRDDPLALIRQRLANREAEQPVEKVYLQLDKPYYAAGDDAWFKAYVVSGSDHHPTTVSGIVDVELVDNHDSVKQSVKLQLAEGAAHGDFAFPDTMHTGTYHIRAYTNYMRNAGSAYFFDQPVVILNTQPKTTLVRKAVGRPDFQFFPEGGYLVSGLSSKIAFKAVASDGLGIFVSGKVTDDAGNPVAAFSSNHLGMGTFEMKPEGRKLYRAILTFADGSQQTAPLPPARENGNVLAVSCPDSSHIQVKINSSDAKPLLFVVQNSQKIYYSAEIPAAKSSTLSIDKSRFPSGIMQLTLFTAKGEPLNERLIFIRNNDGLTLHLKSDRAFYSPRQQVGFQLTAGAKGNFSVAVTDENLVPVNEDEAPNILASLLLTSDLRGFVEQPARYFNHPDAQTDVDLDVLMLTQGYRRFDWKAILQGSPPAPLFAAEQELHISGIILSAGGRPVPQARVKLYDLDSIRFTRDTITGTDGRFNFDKLGFADSSRFIIQARTAKNKRNVSIQMDHPLPLSPQQWLPPFTLGDSSISIFAQSSSALFSKEREFGLGNHIISLAEVTIREKKELLQHSTNLNGPGNADQVFMGSELERLGCIHISDCLQGRLTGVFFRGGVPYSTRGYLPMQLIVDGLYVDGDYLDQLNYTDVQAIEVLRNVSYTSIYGGQGANGVMLVTTKYGGEDEAPEPVYGRGITTYFPKGYYKARSFYSPQYNVKGTNKALADLRTTIYWLPELRTDANGTAAFSYFNAGNKGTYRVVVEGMDEQGHIGRQVFHYQVR